MFQVTVGDGPGEVVSRDESGLDVCREREPPHDVSTAGGEVDSSHAHLGGIGSSQEGRLLRDDFGQVSRSVAEARGQ